MARMQDSASKAKSKGCGHRQESVLRVSHNWPFPNCMKSDNVSTDIAKNSRTSVCQVSSFTIALCLQNDAGLFLKSSVLHRPAITVPVDWA